MDNAELLDKLNRAYIMEEQMTSLLIDLCQPVVLPDDLTENVHKRIEDVLHSIKADTMRHKKIILAIKNKLS
ncbi:MAG: hypothetical protein WCK61_06375 [Candidatus Omnitrophota bacterium]